MSDTRRYYDCHTHTKYSFDAPASGAGVFEMCDAALERGISGIAFTDHYDFADDLYINKNDYDVAAAYREICEVKERYRGRLDVLFGVELGEALDDRRESEALLAKFDFDFVLGSLHNLRGAPDFYYLKFELLPGEHIDAYMDRYFDEVVRTVREFNGISSFAHITYIDRYLAENGIKYDFSRCAERLDAIYRSLIERGVALELNLSTLNKGLDEPSPHFDMIKRYRSLGGELVTVGTDAHGERNVGRGVRDAYEFLSSCGFSFVTVFHGGKPEMIKL